MGYNKKVYVFLVTDSGVECMYLLYVSFVFTDGSF